MYLLYYNNMTMHLEIDIYNATNNFFLIDKIITRIII